MYLVINKGVTAFKVSNFSWNYLHKRSTLDIGVLGYIGIVQHKEHSPEVLSPPPGTPCIIVKVYFKLSDVVLNWSQIVSLYETYLKEYLLRNVEQVLMVTHYL